jgi:hypothetical protein
MKQGDIKISWKYLSAEENPMSDKNRLELRFTDKNGYDKYSVIENVGLSDDINTDILLKALLN